ncbi:MAG: hypothetical protein KIT09_15475 [Bryobacteraceae bacterium]|nr:hypothetical protein [Bryobacteraceae bacterium]
MSKQRVVCVDLDGVLNLYDGWKGAEYFHPPRPGALEFLKALREQNYEIVVFTVRWAPHVWDWIREHGLEPYVDEVTDKKPPAWAYIDDRAICFTGDFQETVQRLRAFRPHWDGAPREQETPAS